jgi:hypothetical protein
MEYTRYPNALLSDMHALHTHLWQTQEDHLSNLTTRVIQKLMFLILYLNTIPTHRVTNEAEIQSHISFTSPRSPG